MFTCQNKYDSIMQKLLKKNIIDAKKILEYEQKLKDSEDSIADNLAHQKNNFELREKVARAIQKEQEINIELNNKIKLLENSKKTLLEKNILIIDASAVVRAKAKKSLADYKVTFCKDTNEAIELIKTKNFDLIITDLDIFNNNLLQIWN
ncbi:response regulator [archaeon]|nr:response regulator [archaeon]NCQ50429.1 response regulator [archaeon]